MHSAQNGFILQSIEIQIYIPCGIGELMNAYNVFDSYKHERSISDTPYLKLLA